jgi:hypothetical protein
MPLYSSAPVLFTVLGLAGCLDDVASTDESFTSEDHEAAGPIFPDSPRESCDLGTSLRCPSSLSFTLNTKVSLITGVGQARAITATSAAALSFDGQNMHCQLAAGIETPNVTGYAIFIPRGTAVTDVASGQAVRFNPPINALNLVPPNPAGLFGAALCGLVCDGETPISAFPGCIKTYKDSLDDGSVTIEGRTRIAELAGRVESKVYDDRTGLLSTTCKLTLPADGVRAQVVKRPNDVIAVDGRRFVRGYELSGQALAGACRALANRSCQPIGRDTTGLAECIESHTDSCFDAFSQPDPCVRVPFPQPR